MSADLVEINRDLRALKRAMANLGVSSRLVGAVETRALRSGRRQTGEYRSNRESRWRLQPGDPQYGTEEDCKLVLLKLLLLILEFQGAPDVGPQIISLAEKYLGREIVKGAYRDPLTKERLSYAAILAESQDPRHGISAFHLGHDDAKAHPKHTPGNVSWRSARSNLIQGDLTLTEARAKFVELIARYFELGEVRIEPDEP